MSSFRFCATLSSRDNSVSGAAVDGCRGARGACGTADALSSFWRRPGRFSWSSRATLPPTGRLAVPPRRTLRRPPVRHSTRGGNGSCNVLQLSAGLRAANVLAEERVEHGLCVTQRHFANIRVQATPVHREVTLTHRGLPGSGERRGCRCEC
ncbi:hypothetical protein T492DRAFT_1047564 [Pavlovales sp. CCMP2436]|nr:hypothetical protein T492DRAFT_1047564 [Pavlovales sp. CCMP2436]